MARTSSFTSSFPEAAFRSGILNTMRMGMPDDVAQQLTWVWRRDQTFAVKDPAGNPYNWTATPTTSVAGNSALPDPNPAVGQTLVVPYALEFIARPAASANTAMGEIDTGRATVTLLDTDYERIKTADYAVIGDSQYRIQFDAPAVGLFGVTVWTIQMEAVDEN